MPPRAALIRCSVGLTLRSASAPISPRVSGVRGRCTVMTSLSASSSSSERGGRRAARRGRPARTGRTRAAVTSNAASRCATSTPMRPSPTTPTVFSASSTPVNFERCQAPPRSEAWACGTLRSDASRRPIACSAALTMFDCGALTTMTPALVAASTSTLSSPTPARATTRSRLATPIASASTWVALRTSSASASGSAASRLGGRRRRRCGRRSRGRAPRPSPGSSAISTTGLFTAVSPTLVNGGWCQCRTTLCQSATVPDHPALNRVRPRTPRPSLESCPDV